jgi:hypothetical protein
MSCNLTITTTKCVPCEHPFDYIFDIAGLGVLNDKNRTAFNELLDNILDKGVIESNCKICCPDCDNIYVFASVETFLKFSTAIYGTVDVFNQIPEVPCYNQDYFSKGCCTNVHASIETYLKYEEAVLQNPDSGEIDPGNLADFPTCCNGFTECVDELVCWASTDLKRNDADPAEIADRILDKGIVEYSSISNCAGTNGSSICKLTDVLSKYYSLDKDAQRQSKLEVIDRILDRGIVVYCNPDTEDIAIMNVDIFIQDYAPTFQILCQSGVPA